MKPSHFARAELETSECRLVISQVDTTRVLVVLEGRDRGRLGREPFRELEKSCTPAGPIDLFFDLERARGATLDVSGSWALWLRANRSRLRRVGMLTGSPFVALSARTVSRFAELGGKAQLYSNRRAFERALHFELPGSAAWGRAWSA